MEGGSDGGRQQHPCTGTLGRQLIDRAKLQVPEDKKYTQMTPVDSNMFSVITLSSKPSLVSQTRCLCPVTLSNSCYPPSNDFWKKKKTQRFVLVCPKCFSSFLLINFKPVWIMQQPPGLYRGSN